MADFNGIVNELHVHQHGQNGMREEVGYAVFNSTDATCTLPSNLNFLYGAEIIAIGAPASDELFYVSGTPDAALGCIPATSGAFTIGRTGAAKTSALKVFYKLIGR